MAVDNLIVEFVVPHYFASLFASQYPDEHGGFGAQVFFRDTHDHPTSAIGDVTFIENDDGRSLVMRLRCGSARLRPRVMKRVPGSMQPESALSLL